MIVAGIGFRKGTSGVEIVAVVDAALAEHGIGRSELALLATSHEKSAEAGAVEAGRLLGLAVVGVANSDLKAQKTLTRSERSLAAAGVPSLSEAAALAAAGNAASLLGPRLAVGPVTCALASQNLSARLSRREGKGEGRGDGRRGRRTQGTEAQRPSPRPSPCLSPQAGRGVAGVALFHSTETPR
jgi:cobalt-precorrin 5A hydrolase